MLERVAADLLAGRLARLRPSAIVVLVAWSARRGAGQNCALKCLALDTGLDRGTVSRAVRELQTRGILRRVGRFGALERA